jgi:hypothetical protein
MSSHSIALAFCMVFMTVFGLAAFYWGKKSISLSKELAAEKLGHANTTQALAFASAELNSFGKTCTEYPAPQGFHGWRCRSGVERLVGSNLSPVSTHFGIPASLALAVPLTS